MFKFENLHFFSKTNFSQTEGDGDETVCGFVFSAQKSIKKRVSNVTSPDGC